MNGLGRPSVRAVVYTRKAQRKAWIKSSTPLMPSMKPAQPI